MSPTTSRRPSTIAELAKIALENLWDEKRDLKHYLRMAEKYRKDARHYADDGEIENAFIAYARAATLVLERLPLHGDYTTVLNPTQRHNLNLNGNEMLERLGELKPILLQRYANWTREHPDEALAEPVQPVRPGDVDENSRKEEYRNHRLDWERERGPGNLRVEPLMRREERTEESRRHDATSRSSAPATVEIKREAAVAAARKAAGRSKTLSHSATPSPPDAWRSQDLQQGGQQRQGQWQQGSSSSVGKRNGALALVRMAANGGAEMFTQDTTPSPTDPSGHDGQLLRFQRQQEEMRLREEEIVRRREQSRREQEAIAKRQQEADETERMVRQSIVMNNPMLTPTAPPPLNRTQLIRYPSPSGPSNSASTSPSPSRLEIPSTYAPAPDVRPSSQFLEPVPSIMPLESPTRYDDYYSTDSEPVSNWRQGEMQRKHPHFVEYPKTPTRVPARSPSYPPPVTTTSQPPPNAGRISYPQLMSQHQRRQGYQPSQNSMFTASADTANDMSGEPKPTVPQPSSFVPQRQQPMQYPFYPTPSRPAPVAPESNKTSTSSSVSNAPHRPPLNVTSSALLRKVNLPRECLPRFLMLAKANTNVNLETCGLLLGKPKGSTKFVVTTLLIPKQHSTSDTCTMDEEELVLHFTETRGLITLGWIHTHPSQSCFMSSLDLHTHSGFQCMLPESFAVVCAPKSNPNFGIFRLTDPPGLKTVLECTAKQAFHPHPDLPIYTDADRGHVRTKDMSLEIVDLR